MFYFNSKTILIMKSSIILTVHNKDLLLWREVLPKLKVMTDWRDTEIIFVLDGCTDTSEAVICTFCQRNPRIKYKILVTDDIHETCANNFGIKASSSKYIIILQDDMVVNEPNWNNRILEPFERWNDVFAVTANCAHNWMHNKDSVGIKDGWSDLLTHIQHANKTNTDRNSFAIRDSVNRGPLAIDRNLLESMGYLDEAFYPCDSDDHDLMYRMHKKMPGMVCGYYNVEWYSNPEWGGTRDSEGKQKQWALDAQIKNTQLLYDRHKDIMNTHQFENRTI